VLTFTAVIALTLQLVAPYLVWRSRWNIPTHLAAGFCVTAYVIPGLFTNVWDAFPNDTIKLYTQINVVGALALVAGLFLGNAVGARSQSAPITVAKRLRYDPESLIWRVMLVVTVATIGIYVSYWIMGFIPMFADDPFSAKQFKGIYRDMYYRAAYPFRFSFSVLSASIPLLLVLAWLKRSPYLMILATLAFLAIFVSLARSATATGVLFFLGVLAARSQLGMRWYYPLVLLVFPFGSVFYYLLGHVLEVQALQSGYVGENFSDYISSGAPDIVDQLGWLYGFMGGDYFSMGRTMYGGLIPGNYEWNPSVWTLTFNDVGADISEMVTGGLRLSAAEWGYANFGWYGVVGIPMLSGFFNGMMLQRIKSLLPTMNTIQITAALMLYSTLGMQIVQFYTLSIHNIPAIAVSLYFWFAVIRRKGARAPIPMPIARRPQPAGRLPRVRG
jgi:hypothetical protein